MEDIMGRPKKMKGGKTAGIVVEILKNGGISIIDCLLRILNRCLEFGVGPAEWKKESIVKDCLRKRGLDIRQARRMVQNRSEWRGFVRGNAWGVAWEMNP